MAAPPFDWVILISAAGLLAMLLFVGVVKIWNVHLAMFRVADDVANIRRETEVLFSQIQALMALERTLQLSEPLPAVRGWAGSPDFLLAIAEQVRLRRPRTVVECGSGVSTIVAARCLQLNSSGRVYSLEHEPAFAENTRRLLSKYGLTEWATVIDAPLQTVTTETPWYSEQGLPENLEPIEMLVVDGPPADVASLVRAPALPRLRSRMASRFIVMVDDADRRGEIEMIRGWRLLEPRLKESRLPAEKGLVALELER